MKPRGRLPSLWVARFGCVRLRHPWIATLRSRRQGCGVGLGVVHGDGRKSIALVREAGERCSPLRPVLTRVQRVLYSACVCLWVSVTTNNTQKPTPPHLSLRRTQAKHLPPSPRIAPKANTAPPVFASEAKQSRLTKTNTYTPHDPRRRQTLRHCCTCSRL